MYVTKFNLRDSMYYFGHTMEAIRYLPIIIFLIPIPSLISHLVF